MRGLFVPGFCPITKIASVLSKSSSRTVPFADADALRQAHAGRLVTHVRAIGKVICAEAPHEDLVEKRRFVRSAARRIEVRPVGALQRPKMRADHCESVVPAGRLIVICRAVVAHRLRQASLLFQPVIALPFQFADRLGRKELGRHLSLCEFKGDGFRAVLAELKRASMLRIRPCASRAVEAVRLVHRQQRL